MRGHPWQTSDALFAVNTRVLPTALTVFRLAFMAPKTAQLQIRVSPAQKAMLERLAAAEGLTVSEFVLRKAQPQGASPQDTRRDAVQNGLGLSNSTSHLALALGALNADGSREATVHADSGFLSPLHANCLAAEVERQAARRGVPAPKWTEAVRPMARPWFAWRLRSLRPHLMRIAPPAYKRRGVYLTTADDPRR